MWQFRACCGISSGGGSSLRVASAMVGRQAFSRENLEAAGERSVRAAREKLANEIGSWVKDVELACRYSVVISQREQGNKYYLFLMVPISRLGTSGSSGPAAPTTSTHGRGDVVK